MKPQSIPKKIIWTIHGALGSEQEFLAWNKLLQQKLNADGSNIEIKTITLPGHGGRSSEKYQSTEELVMDLYNTYNSMSQSGQQEMPEFYILGYSLGGYLALSLLGLLNTKKNPGKDSLKGIYTYGTKFYWSSEDVANFHQRLSTSAIQSHEKMQQAFLKIHGENWKTAVECFHHLLDNIEKYPLSFKQTLHSLGQTKVRIAMGDQDKLADQNQFRKWQEREFTFSEELAKSKNFDSMEIVQIKNSGHEWPKINQEEWANDVAKWIFTKR